MGACGSKDDDHEEVDSSRHKKSTDPAEVDVQVKSPTPRGDQNEEGEETDQKEQPIEDDGVESTEDFRETMKLVLVMILERLLKALEYEKEGYLEVAEKRGKATYLDLIAPEVFEKVLLDTWKLEGTEPTDLPANDDINYAAHKFRGLLTAVNAPADWADPNISKKELTDRVQKAVAASKEEMRLTIEACPASDLKLHLMYFIRCLGVMQGDIATVPGLLWKQMEALNEE